MRGPTLDHSQSKHSYQESRMTVTVSASESSPPPPPRPGSTGMGRPGPNHPTRKIESNAAPEEADQDSESDVVHPDQQNRTRQKKFVKNFKGLPIEETVHKRMLDLQFPL